MNKRNKANKRRKRKKKELRHKQQFPKLKLSLASQDRKFRADFIDAMHGQNITAQFWKAIPLSWRRGIIRHYDRSRRLLADEIEYFRR